MPTKKRNPAEETAERLMPPPNGAVVRMYRIGHGDCFLIAFAGDKKDEPVYVLIDCGYKPGSPGFIDPPTTPKEITQNIREATGGHIHVAVITHEHQDHVNAITETNFKDIKIDKTWLAWTENPNDKVANDLRKVYKDKLLGLIAARNQLAAAGDERRERIDTFLAFELGGEEEDDKFDAAAAKALLGAAGAGGGSMNKKSMKIFKDRAKDGVKFLLPHGEIERLPGAKNVRVFAFGPPRNLTELQDLDPQGKEEFHGLAMASPGNYFAAAAIAADAANAGERRDKPFARRYQVDWQQGVTGNEQAVFFKTHYGQKGDPPVSQGSSDESDYLPEEKVSEIPLNAEWRRIDNEWLFSAENLALAMNNDTNNASLVLAFELGKDGRVLLFVGDAQRGNWMSWANGDWTEDGEKITVKDLLSRAVLYKVGHHCSHNATLNGLSTDDYPNIGWMATGKYANEFVAMITAVRAWAETQKGWNHPLKAIKDELVKKASGRVFQTDTDFGKMPNANASKAEWAAFRARTRDHRLYFDCEIRA